MHIEIKTKYLISCDHCGDLVTVLDEKKLEQEKARMIRHEAICRSNPETKRCWTCKNHDYFTDCYGEHYGCDIHKKYSEKPNKSCWESRERK